MPYRTKFVYAAVALKHAGVTLYHVYKDDDVENGARTYSFVTDASDGEMDDSCIDVRDLPNWKTDPKRHPECYIDSDDHIRAVLREAIDLGHIKKPTT